MSSFPKHLGVSLLATAPSLPFWITSVMMSSKVGFVEALGFSLVSIGVAAMLGVWVWDYCERTPWPSRHTQSFYVRHLLLSVAFAAAWVAVMCVVNSARYRSNLFPSTLHSPNLSWQLFMGTWIYIMYAGVAYAVHTKKKLHEEQLAAARAAELAAAARFEALQARLNPHFLFNALHTLSSLVRSQPDVAERATEQLGTMLRYSLGNESRRLVDFAEEMDFTKQYLEFERLRFGDRLRVHIQVDPAASSFELPPFSLQTLVENAVHHAVSLRPSGGSVWIHCDCASGNLQVTVRDDGPGTGAQGDRTQYGIRSLRERLEAAFGIAAKLELIREATGFLARIEIPAENA